MIKISELIKYMEKNFGGNMFVDGSEYLKFYVNPTDKEYIIFGSCLNFNPVGTISRDKSDES
jgi:hypothetical protein